MTLIATDTQPSSGGYVDVAVPLGVRKTFAYSVPADLRAHLSVGARVLVPFGRKLLTGYAVCLGDTPPAGSFKVRALRAVIDPRPLIPPGLVAVALWVAEYYFTPPGPILSALFPIGSQITGTDRVRLSARGAELIRDGLPYPGLQHEEAAILRTLAGKGALSLKQLEAGAGIRDSGQYIESLAAREWLELEEFLEKPRVRRKTQLGIRGLAKNVGQAGVLTEAQGRLLVQLEASDSLRPLQAVLGLSRCSLSVARTLERKGLVEIAPLEVDRLPIELSQISRRQELVFTDAQRVAFESLCALLERGTSHRCLLHGITGSGKTEIYLRLISEVLRRGEGTMFLVPEIALTPLLSRTVATYFPGQVALLHSGMSAGERLDQWNRIRSGRARVVLGTRSAVFAPIEKLRLIIIDEEQDSSYKQDESPYYHAREVAWQRIQQSHGILLMGSATPSIETHHAAVATGEITRLTLPERIQARPLPEVTIVDMGLEFERHGRSTVISRVLQDELLQRLSRGEQSMVLLNRRGFSRSLLCRSCGHVFTCPDCSISMTYHQETARLVCHYCATESSIPDACSNCGGTYIYYVGVGTEQLEQILRSMLPQARIARVDRDSTRRRGALRRILLEFEERNLDLLVGTQLLAKGHDFPNVTLVGVVGADVGLSFPDFRAAERTFQLLTQVAGRAGRGEAPGRVVIQTFYPNHYALLHARKQDYGGFYSQEIEFRRLLGYPPFKKLIQILVTDKSPEKGARIAEKVASAIRRQCQKPEFRSHVQVLGPAPAPLEKLRGLYRFQILIKGPHGTGASTILREVFGQLGRHRVPIRNVHVDVDPLSVL